MASTVQVLRYKVSRSVAAERLEGDDSTKAMLSSIAKVAGLKLPLKALRRQCKEALLGTPGAKEETLLLFSTVLAGFEGSSEVPEELVASLQMVHSNLVGLGAASRSVPETPTIESARECVDLLEQTLKDLLTKAEETGSNSTPLPQSTRVTLMKRMRDVEAWHIMHFSALRMAPSADLRAAAAKGLILVSLVMLFMAYKDFHLSEDARKAAALGGSGMVLSLEVVQQLQFHAASIASLQGGWKNSADAVCLRGLAQAERHNDSEAVRDMSAALKMRRRTWLCDNYLKGLAESRLEKCRCRISPLFGNWQAMEVARSELCNRFAAASAQVGRQLYFFGGISSICRGAARKSDDPELKMFLWLALALGLPEAESRSKTLNDICVLDLETNTVRQLLINGYAPSPRAYALLCYERSGAAGSDADKVNRLYLMGGRRGYGGAAVYPEVWSFHLDKMEWRLLWDGTLSLPGCDMWIADVQLIGNGVILHSKWYVVAVQRETEKTVVLCFDLVTLKWSTPAVAGTGPALSRHDGTSFFSRAEQTLYLWARTPKRSDKIITNMLWGVEFRVAAAAQIDDDDDDDYGDDGPRFSLSWVANIIVAQQGQFPAANGRKAIDGPATLVYAETASCIDEATGKAYIFGGWHGEMWWFGCANTRAQTELGNCILVGKYNATLIELDLARKESRTVEAASRISGPSFRADCTLGVWDHRVHVVGGYTTLDAVENLYAGIRSFEEAWCCALLTDDSAPRGPTSPSATAAATATATATGGGGGGGADSEDPAPYNGPGPLACFGHLGPGVEPHKSRLVDPISIYNRNRVVL